MPQSSISTKLTPIMICPCHKLSQSTSTSTNKRSSSSDEEISSPSPSTSHSPSSRKSERTKNADADANDTKVYCKTCIGALLDSKISKHRSTLYERNIQRELCAKTLTQLRSGNSKNSASSSPSPLQRISQYQDQIQTLSTSIEQIRKECSTKSVSLASYSILQSNRAVQLDQKRRSVMMLREHLELLRSSILVSDNFDLKENEGEHDLDRDTVSGGNDGDHASANATNANGNGNGQGNLASTIQKYVDQVKRKRYQLILETFAMHRMDVGHEHKSLTMDDLLAGMSDDEDDVGDDGDGKDEGGTGTSANALTPKSNINHAKHSLQQQQQQQQQKKKNQTQQQKKRQQQRQKKQPNITTTTKNNNHTRSSTTNNNTRFQKRVRQRIPSGIGKIGGSLLFPHRGPSVYNKLLPPNVLTSSIRLIASLTNVLARCLSIELPHPIVLCPMVNTNTLRSVNGRYGVRRDELWLRDQTADIVECAVDIHVTDDADADADVSSSLSANDNDANFKNDGINGLTLMRDLEKLDRDIGFDNGSGKVRNTDNGTRGSAHAENYILDETGTGHIENVGVASSVNTTVGKGSMGMSGMSTSSLRSLVGSSSNLLSRAFDKMGMKGHHQQHHQHQHHPHTHASAGISTHQNNHKNHRSGHHPQHYQHSSLEKAKSSHSANTIAQVPMDNNSIALRLKYATHAIIYESNSRKNGSGSVVKYELKPPSSSTNDLEIQQQEEEHFTIGLQLLQNDIIALCIQSGVPVRMLWPAEAMLLNLNSLKLYVTELLKKESCI